jgi:predicted aconitase with swiveling domain
MKKLFTLAITAFTMLFFAQQAEAQEHFLTINAPGNIAGEVSPVGSPNADFGGNLVIGEFVTGDLAIALGSDPDPLIANQACDSIINPADVAGKIAIVRRGSCAFSDKIWHAQNAGAIAVIICNNEPADVVINMAAGGTWPGQDTIPSIMASSVDCAEIFTELAAGNTVNVTISGPKPFYEHVLSYAYHTPQNQIIPMNDIHVNLINATGAEATGVNIACTITDPDGNETVLETTVNVLPDGVDTLVYLPSYTPSALGAYTAVFSNSLTSDVLTDGFVITEDLFATDRGTISTDNNRQDLFEANGLYQYHYGNLYQTGSTPVIATHISFGIGNADTLTTGNPDFDLVTLVLYNGDADNDDTLDLVTPSFDDLTAIGLGQYFFDGSEGPQDVLTGEIFSTTGLENILLDTSGAYYAVIKYDGDATTATTCPSFIGSEWVNYDGFTTCLYLGGTFYGGGWADASVLARLHVDETTSSTDNLARLDDTKARIFPNPANQYVNLELQLAEMADQVRVHILNYDSKVVGAFELNNVQEGVFNFNTENLVSGMYFLSVKTPEGYRSLPFMVVH